MIIGLMLKGFFAERMKNPINRLWVVITASAAHPYHGKIHKNYCYNLLNFNWKFSFRVACQYKYIVMYVSWHYNSSLTGISGIMFAILRYHVNELWIMLVLINVITLGTLWCMVKNYLQRRYQFRLTPTIGVFHEIVSINVCERKIYPISQ